MYISPTLGGLWAGLSAHIWPSHQLEPLIYSWWVGSTFDNLDLTHEIWLYLWENGVRTVLNCRTCSGPTFPVCVSNCVGELHVGVGNRPVPYGGDGCRTFIMITKYSKIISYYQWNGEDRKGKSMGRARETQRHNTGTEKAKVREYQGRTQKQRREKTHGKKEKGKG